MTPQLTPTMRRTLRQLRPDQWLPSDSLAAKRNTVEALIQRGLVAPRNAIIDHCFAISYRLTQAGVDEAVRHTRSR